MFNPSLIRAINNGRCFVFVGSGPSCEIGYPSWKKLAELVYEKLRNNGCISDYNSYEKYIEEKKYPELFRQAEFDLGSRTMLVDLIKKLLIPEVKHQSSFYELITKWPFSCYITTNYDNEIATHLASSNEYFAVVRNRKEDFYPIRDGANRLILKLHSDLDHPDEVILTSADYQRLYIDDSGQYFRDKLRQIFEIFDIFIIGYSLSDHDIDYALQLAKKTASPQHPIFMVAADCTKADEREYFEKYNIVLIPYSNHDGTHTELRRILKTVDRFIVPRNRLWEGGEAQTRPKEETEAAIALYLYRRLQGIQTTDYLSPLILSVLSSVSDHGISLDVIASTPIIKHFANEETSFKEAINEAIKNLISQGLVSSIAEEYKITNRGREKVEEFKAIRETEKDQAYGQFRITLKNSFDEITEIQLDQCQKLAEKVIVSTFANRGLTITNQLFAGQLPSHGELSDVFENISITATELSENWLKAAFVEAMHQFLLEPNSPQLKYLASISQGYFLYHLLGLDPKGCQARLDIFQNTIWLCDSSIVLPYIAVGCYNHNYSNELFNTLVEKKAFLFTTPKLLQEVWEHFDWALNFIKNTNAESPEFINAALVKGGYKQNLFLDGFIRLSADGQIGTFKEYIDLIFQHGNIDRSTFDKNITSKGVKLISISDIKGFIQDDWGEIEEAKTKIKSEREKRGIFRSTLQVEAEAEIFVLIKNVRLGKYLIDSLNNFGKVYFVSQSRIIDQVFQPNTSITWSPEALYRYLSTLPGHQTNPDLLQECMLHQYYYAGISFIDKRRYMKFFGPYINAAKTSYEKEKANYINELEERFTRNIDDAYEKTPDLEKPFFVAQMAWRLAEESKKREKLASDRALDAEEKVRQLEFEKSKAWKTRQKKMQEQEAARLRNLQNPKHLSKRLKQSKKKKKKKHG